MIPRRYGLIAKYDTKRRALASPGLSWPDVLIFGHILIYLVSILAVIFFPGISPSIKLFYTLGLIYAGLLSVLVLAYVRFSGTVEILLCNLLVGYITVGFVAKLPVMLYFPETLAIVSGLPSLAPAWVIENLPSTFEIFLTGYSAFVFGILVYFVIRKSALKKPSVRHEFLPPEPYRLGWLTIVVICFLVAKWLLHKLYLIGAPGVIPKQLPISDLTGIISILMQQGLLYLVNLGLLHALASKRQRSILLYAFFILAFVAMNVAFSKKGMIFFEPLILFWIFVINRKWISKQSAHVAIIAAILIIVIGIPLYKYMNAYRININKGAALVTAVENATSSSRLAGTSSLVGIYARIVGLDALEQVSQTRLRKISGNGNLVTADMEGQYKQAIGLGSQQVVAFAFTQFSRAYAISGYGGLVIYMGILGFGYFLIYHAAIRYVVRRSASRSVLSAVLGLVFLHYAMSGASPILTLKHLIVIFLVAFLTERTLELGGRISEVHVQTRANSNAPY